MKTNCTACKPGKPCPAHKKSGARPPFPPAGNKSPMKPPKTGFPKGMGY